MTKAFFFIINTNLFCFSYQAENESIQKCAILRWWAKTIGVNHKEGKKNDLNLLRQLLNQRNFLHNQFKVWRKGQFRRRFDWSPLNLKKYEVFTSWGSCADKWESFIHQAQLKLKPLKMIPTKNVFFVIVFKHFE